MIPATTLHIKNMVCNRCISVVKDELENLGLNVEHIRLGEIILKESEDKIDKTKIASVLTSRGFELLDDKKSLILEKIKTTVIEQIHYPAKHGGVNYNFSLLIEEKLGLDYNCRHPLFRTVLNSTFSFKYHIYHYYYNPL